MNDVIMSTESQQAGGKRRYRRFTMQDLQDVARLAVHRHTDKAACELLGLQYDSFRKWRSKNRNEARFEDSIMRARAIQLQGHLENIADAAVGAGVHKKADWRASKALIEIKFPELAPQAGVVTREPTVNVLVMSDTLKRIYDVEPVAPKLLSAVKPPIKLPTRRT